MWDETRSKIKLAFLLLVAFVPITMASIAFRSAVENGGFGDTVNKGHLILPPADITDLTMTDDMGRPIFRSFEERIAELENEDDYVPEPWLMVFVTARNCDAECDDRIHLLRQMHITLNKNMPRVRRYYVNATGAELSAQAAEHFRIEYPSMGVANGDKDAILTNLAAKNVNIDLDNNNYIFFVDPVGNVMMYYEPHHTIEEIKADLVKLLGISSLG